MINDFTVYFPETSFAGLVLNSGPAGWDSPGILTIRQDRTVAFLADALTWTLSAD